MNITIRTAFGQEKSVFHSINCTTFRYRYFKYFYSFFCRETIIQFFFRFAKADHNFGMEDNVNLTTFYVYVYDFQPPLWIQISFSQYPKLNLQQFFITFSSYVFFLFDFICLIVVSFKNFLQMFFVIAACGSVVMENKTEV